MKKIAKLNLNDLREGDEYYFEEVITQNMVDQFASLSGDYSSLHMDNKFAIKRGFNDRVVHGALLISLLSRLVGMHFPGENAIIQTLNIRFCSPVYINDSVKIKAEVYQISNSTNTMVIKTLVENTNSGEALLIGKLQIGFTNE